MNVTDCPSLLVFGGSFDPPHLGHVRLPMIVREKLGFDLVAYIPAARPPHKLDQARIDPAHRLALLRLALADQPHAVILTDELDRSVDGKPSYTVDTLAALRQRLRPDAVMRLLIGSDQLLIFNQWKDPHRIVQLAQPLVMLRLAPPQSRQALLEQLPPDQRELWRARLVEVPAIDISSTDIRRRVADHQPIDQLVAPAVAQYIQRHHLYQRPPRPPSHADGAGEQA